MKLLSKSFVKNGEGSIKLVAEEGEWSPVRMCLGSDCVRLGILGCCHPACTVLWSCCAAGPCLACYSRRVIMM
jgi:hypothetical protein